MNVSRISKLFLLIAIMLLIGNTVAISRDYQDSWILEGLEIPFTLFVITYAIAFSCEIKTLWMVVLAAIGRTVFLLIPNLKYVWFQGAFIDQNVQYALANYVFNQGHIATQFAIGQPYITAPLMHLSFSIFSIILNVPVVDSMKYLPVLWSPLYPLVTCVIVKRMKFSKETTILKYALFISSVPFTLLQYVVTGTLLGILLAFLVLSTLILALEKKDRRIWFICVIFVFALSATHSVTSVILVVSLLAILVLQRVLHFRPRSYLRSSTVLGVASIILAWLVFSASLAFQEITHLIFIGAPRGMTPKSEYISPSFFEHARTNILSAARSFTVYYGADAFLLLLTLFGLIILLKRRKKLNSVANFLSLFELLVFLFIVIGYLMKVGATRSLTFAELLFPIFSSVLILQMKNRAWIRPFIFISLILLATIQLYGCQPLVPPANVLFKGLPSDVPMGFVNLVNSVYQRQMIEFAESHIKGIIAAGEPTAAQVVGLAGTNFSMANLVWYYPFDKNQTEQRYDYSLVQIPGRSGTPSVEPALQPASVILEGIYNSSIVYTNGESFVLAHR